MKKQTVIMLILCVLLATVIALSLLGKIGPQGSLTGYNKGVPTVSPENTKPSSGDDWDYSEPTTA